MATKMDWLAELEAKVHEAAEQLTALREENQGLEERVKELEAKLAAGSADSAGEANGWAEERDEIRRRVSALTEVLEGLIES